MKLLASLALIVTTCAATPALAADASPACAAKRASIETQLSQASARGRTQEVAGLQKALKANQAHCTDESLAKERAQKIRQAQQKVDARERSLQEAQRKGDPKKIESRKEKLEQARRDLVQAQKPLGQ